MEKSPKTRPTQLPLLLSRLSNLSKLVPTDNLRSSNPALQSSQNPPPQMADDEIPTLGRSATASLNASPMPGIANQAGSSELTRPTLVDGPRKQSILSSRSVRLQSSTGPKSRRASVLESSSTSDMAGAATAGDPSQTQLPSSHDPESSTETDPKSAEESHVAETPEPEVSKSAEAGDTIHAQDSPPYSLPTPQEGLAKAFAKDSPKKTDAEQGMHEENPQTNTILVVKPMSSILNVWKPSQSSEDPNPAANRILKASDTGAEKPSLDYYNDDHRDKSKAVEHDELEPLSTEPSALGSGNSTIRPPPTTPAKPTATAEQSDLAGPDSSRDLSSSMAGDAMHREKALSALPSEISNQPLARTMNLLRTTAVDDDQATIAAPVAVPATPIELATALTMLVESGAVVSEDAPLLPHTDKPSRGRLYIRKARNAALPINLLKLILGHELAQPTKEALRLIAAGESLTLPLYGTGGKQLLP